MPAIEVQGNFNVDKVYGLQDDESQLYRIASAQVFPSENGVDGEGGLDKLKSFTEEAARKGADVIVFPEYFLTGSTHDIWRAVRKNSQDKEPDKDPGHFLAVISSVAKENDIDIVAGTVVELGSHHVPHRSDTESDDAAGSRRGHNDKLFNTCYYVERTGKVVGRYTKKNLWHPEKSVLSPGHELLHEIPTTFDITTKRGAKLKAGLRICWDLGFPESFREMFDIGKDGQNFTGPDVVFAPTCWYTTDAGQKGLRWNLESEALLLDSICMTRAIENECILAMTNVAGPLTSSKSPQEWTEDDAIAVGRTSVCAPFVGCVGRIESGNEKLLLSCVDLRVLEDARSIYRCRQDIKQALCGDGK
ncbi:hypothetical protein CBS101457_006685 [Exobasidium rhododendri]|nr:hypothetical protein CBS101457_006685 [Exobasidium rhododendri]